jgi:flagellar biosynthesis/type III secretory pathway protein FliH
VSSPRDERNEQGVFSEIFWPTEPACFLPSEIPTEETVMAGPKLRYSVAPFVSAGALAVAVSAQAQSVAWRSPAEAAVRYADDQRASYYDSRRIAYDQGYREGIKEGEKDARRGERFNYQDEKEFRNADRGYHRNYGDRERYRQSFRSGYAAGYDDGYRRLSMNGRNGNRGRPGSPGVYGNRGYGGYGNYGGRYGYYSPAFDNGARDGYEKGQEDIRKNRSFDPLRHSWYRSGDRHYEREYGSRDEYKNVYRRGFQEGYQRGYREARAYGW